MEGRLTLKDVLMMKEIWPAKFETYSKKNKLEDMKSKGITQEIEEFYRRLNIEEIEEISNSVNFWAKIERCDFTQNPKTLQGLFNKLRKIYEMIGGFIPQTELTEELVAEGNFAKCFKEKVQSTDKNC
jgi:hypothetical protein